MKTVGAVLAALLALGAPGRAQGDGTPVAPASDDRLPTASQLHEAMGLATELLEREREQMKQERRRLEMLREEIRLDLQRLGDLYARLDGPLKSASADARKARVRHIAKSLSSMSPRAAAVAVERMDDGLAVELLSVVDGKKVGKILEQMKAERAAVLMQKVVGARKSAGKPRGKGRR